jgi:serine/threonine-protein kinase
MGVVFLARDTTLDRPVAVKVVHPDLAIHSSITQRFLAEARMIARLRHPSIVAVHTAGEATGVFYYVMDYVPGESLRQRLTKEGKLPVAEVSRIVADLADALHSAGQAGLVHRDVKPENILLDEATGRAMLADFGIARAMAADPDGARTGQGVAVGTPTYMSPEQAAGDTVDARSDLYALGVVAFELLTGRPPFRGQTAAAVATMHLAEQPTPVESLRPDTSPQLARAIMRSLAKDPADRWQTGAELRTALLGGVVAMPRRKMRPGRLAGIITAIMVVALVVAWALAPGGPPKGVNPRHSILVLPFDNLRQDPTVAWLRDGSVNMLALNLSQWNDLNVIDHERLHDLLGRRKIENTQALGLDMARQLARDAGVWTVILGDFTKVGDSLQLVARIYDVHSGRRLDVARVEGKPGDDVRPLFDQLALRLLNLSGAPQTVRADLVSTTTMSLEAYRSYLQGLEDLNTWNLGSAQEHLSRAVRIDPGFGLAYYKLSLARGWLAGQGDSMGLDAIRRATVRSDRLPEHDRAMITAYRAFAEGDYARSETAYRALVQRDSTDADAWYGLGDVLFHNPNQGGMANRFSQSLRAFKRAITLDPGYYLAYEHLIAIYRFAGQNQPMFALLPNDSLVSLLNMGGDKAAVLDSGQAAQALKRARDQGVASAREWLVQQPENAHAQNALVNALATGRQFDAALAELTRIGNSPEASGRPDLAFLRAQILTQQGQPNEAAKVVAKAMDSVRPERFDAGRLPAFEVLAEVANGANVLAYAGQVDLASRTLDLAAQLSAQWNPEAAGSDKLGSRTLYGHLLQSHLFTALGAPAEHLRPVWEAVADSARRSPRTGRGSVAEFGWAAAVGLFLQNPSNPTPLNEFTALSGSALPAELQALLALERGDSAEARRQLARPDSTMPKLFQTRPQWYGYRHMIAAYTYAELGDNSEALKSLSVFDPARFSTNGLDVRWLLLGQARLLRGEILERQGKQAEAREQYQAALAQWELADPALNPLVARVKERLDRLGTAG